MRYPEGSAEGRELFRKLEEKAGKGLYDDDFLLALIEYQRVYPKSEHFDLFYGRYAAFHGNYEVALEHAERAYRKRRMCLEVWKLLVECYVALGRPEKAMPFQAYCCKLYQMELRITASAEQIQKNLSKLTMAMGTGVYAPFCESRMFWEGEALLPGMGIFCGEYLPVQEDAEGYRYWVGVYNESSYKGAHGIVLDGGKKSAGFIETFGADFVFDVMRSKVSEELVVDPGDSPVALPIAATAAVAPVTPTSSTPGKQWVTFESRDASVGAWIGQWEYGFFRVSRRTRIASERPLAFGRPVPLVHSKHRRRVVLNILVDALNWKGFSQENFRYVPNIMAFFASKGILFRQHFSVSEYTYPSLPTIETGLYPHHSQIFHYQIAEELDRSYVTLSERMKELGYYCVNVMGSGDTLYNGSTRGYDRLLVNAYDLPAYAGVERVIRQLEAFSECDQFLFLHLTEAHPGANTRFPADLETQVKIPLEERGEDADAPSVFLPRSPFYMMANRHGIMRIDRSLGALFDYISAHYSEDEYLVQLYSDHGLPVYDEILGVVNEGKTHALYMLRGSGVPHYGMVDELTSAVDLYPVMGKLAGFPVGDWVDGNLPAALGGRERECVYSNSLYPGQTYKLCIRTRDHEFYLESREPVNDDGTVDLSGAETRICARGDDSGTSLEDMELERYFFRRAEDFTSSINHGGRQWDSLVKAHPEWYGKGNGDIWMSG